MPKIKFKKNTYNKVGWSLFIYYCTYKYQQEEEAVYDDEGVITPQITRKVLADL